jgi:hypothetical protein
VDWFSLESADAAGLFTISNSAGKMPHSSLKVTTPKITALGLGRISVTAYSVVMLFRHGPWRWRQSTLFEKENAQWRKAQSQ